MYKTKAASTVHVFAVYSLYMYSIFSCGTLMQNKNSDSPYGFLDAKGIWIWSCYMYIDYLLLLLSPDTDETVVQGMIEKLAV